MFAPGCSGACLCDTSCTLTALVTADVIFHTFCLLLRLPVPMGVVAFDVPVVDDLLEAMTIVADFGGRYDTMSCRRFCVIVREIRSEATLEFMHMYVNADIFLRRPSI